MVYQTQHQKRVAARKEKEAREKAAADKETFDRFLERMEAAQLRQFYKFCDGESWHFSGYFDEDYELSDSEDEKEGEGEGEDNNGQKIKINYKGGDKQKDFRRRGRADVFRKTLFNSSSRTDDESGTNETKDGKGKRGAEVESGEGSVEETDSLATSSLVTMGESEEDGLEGGGGIDMHPSISTLGDPSMTIEGEGSIVLPGEEGLVGTAWDKKPPKPTIQAPPGSPPKGPGGPKSPHHGTSIAKEESKPPDKWFWGGKGKEAWWGVKSLKRRVAKIDLHENNLEGTLPGGPGTGIFPVEQPLPPEGHEETLLGHLRILVLFKNALSGPLPASYSKFSMLQHLDLSHNQLSGDIPESIFEIKALKRVHFEHNYMLTGSIPESFCNLDKLQAFTIHYNKMTGTLPERIGDCKNLKEFSIHHNSMEGPIPESIVELTNLERCYINNNHFTGDEAEHKELQQRLIEAGNFMVDERVGFSKVLAVMPQPEESDDEEEDEETGEDTGTLTIDATLTTGDDN